MDLNSMPVDVLETILLHVDSAVSLVRASSTCKLWRHLVSGAVFLRRFGSLHELPVVGYCHNDEIGDMTSCPRYEPTTTDIGSRRRLSVGGFPLKAKPLRRWTVKDSRGSLVLLELDFVKGTTRHRSLYVAEPPTGRSELVASVKTPASYLPLTETQAFLLDAPQPGEVVGMSNFRVVCMPPRGSDAGIITSGAGMARKVKTGNDQEKKMLCLGSAGGSMYWYTDAGTVFALDKATAEFSSSSLPDGVVVTSNNDNKLAVTTGRDGKVRLVFLDAGGNLNIFAIAGRRNDYWVLEKTVRGPSAATLGVTQARKIVLGHSLPLSADEDVGTVKLLAYKPGRKTPSEFTLDMEAKQSKRTKDCKAYPITMPWPPSMQACTTG